jgi:hypothetical protein
VPGIGRYHYEKPESTLVTLHNIRGADTATHTYSANGTAGCSGDIIVGIITDPVLSSAGVGRWNDSAEVVADSAGICAIKNVNEFGTYYYTIDKSTWLIRSISKSTSYYWMSFLYGQDKGYAVLRKACANGDTTLKSGGYEFFNIKINGEDVSQMSNPVIARQSSAGCLVYTGRSSVTIVFPSSLIEQTPFAVYNPAGKQVLSRILAPGSTGLTVQSGDVGVRGRYILRVGSGADSYSAAISLLR